MNNELIKKIADLLEITTQKASELYPQLIKESVIYSFIGNLILGIIIIDVLAFLGWDEIEWNFENEKVVKLIQRVLIVLTVLACTLYVIRPYLTPTITFLKGVFNV